MKQAGGHLNEMHIFFLRCVFLLSKQFWSKSAFSYSLYPNFCKKKVYIETVWGFENIGNNSQLSAKV